MTVEGGTISNEGTASITTLGNIDEAEYRVEVVVENGGQIDAGNELHIGGGYGQATLTLMTGGSVSGGTVRVWEGGPLAGEGDVNANLFADGGHVSPGLSPGVMNVNGDFTLTEGKLALGVERHPHGTLPPLPDGTS